MQKQVAQFISVSLALAGFACGQNAHVTAPAGAITPGNEDQKRDLVGPTGAMGPTGTAGTPGPKGDTGPSGHDGKDGCGNEPFVATFEARPLTASETATSALPYQSGNGHEFTTIEVGDMTGIVQGGLAYVQASQVLFAFDALLPPRASVQKIDRASLELSVTKLVNACNSGSEILCSLDSLGCSGHPYDKTAWQANYDSAFWGTNGAANSLFSDLIQQHRMKNISNMWGSGDIELELSDFLRGSQTSDVLQFLYGGDSGTKTDNHVLRFAVADDVYVGSARLTVELEINTCAARD